MIQPSAGFLYSKAIYQTIQICWNVYKYVHISINLFIYCKGMWGSSAGSERIQSIQVRRFEPQIRTAVKVRSRQIRLFSPALACYRVMPPPTNTVVPLTPRATSSVLALDGLAARKATLLSRSPLQASSIYFVDIIPHTLRVKLHLDVRTGVSCRSEEPERL